MAVDLKYSISSTADVISFDEGNPMVLRMKACAERLVRAIRYVLSEINLSPDLLHGDAPASTFAMYQLLSVCTRELISAQRDAYPALYSSIFRDWDDIFEECRNMLESALKEFRIINFNEETLNSYAVHNNADFYIKEGQLAQSFEDIEANMLTAYKTNFLRTTEERGIILSSMMERYRTNTFDEYWLRSYKPVVTNLYGENLTSDDVIGYRKTLLPSVSPDNVSGFLIQVKKNNINTIADDLVRKQFTRDDFVKGLQTYNLLMYMDEWADTLKDNESLGDPFFSRSVNVTKLVEQMHEYWIPAYIKTQEYWLAVYVAFRDLGYIRQQYRGKTIGLEDFCLRMQQLFPNAEKKCSHESIRKLINRDNHNQHLSCWSKKDKFYEAAHSLVEKFTKNPPLLDLQ